MPIWPIISNLLGYFELSKVDMNGRVRSIPYPGNDLMIFGQPVFLSFFKHFISFIFLLHVGFYNLSSDISPKFMAHKKIGYSLLLSKIVCLAIQKSDNRMSSINIFHNEEKPIHIQKK